MDAKTSDKKKSINSVIPKAIFQNGKLRPSVSILLPVNKKYPLFKDAEQKLKSLIKEAETTLREQLSKEMAESIILKLQETVAPIDYTHLSESLAIFVSSEVQKVVHLSVPVEEKLVIGRTFELRDLFLAAKMNFHYLVVTISEKKVRLFSGYGNQLQEEQADQMPFGMHDVQGEGHSRVQSFSSFASSRNVSDENSYLENMMEKYLRDIDQELSSILKLQMVPVIICGVQKEISAFKKITKNLDSIIGTIEGNFDYMNEPEVLNKVKPILAEQSRNEEKKELALLDEAVSKKTFASGIKDVWRAVLEKRGRLLLVEKDYRCAGKQGRNKYTLITNDIDTSDTRNIADAVDDLIEYTFEFGGDVAFVENGALNEHGEIALITFYNVNENFKENAV